VLASVEALTKHSPGGSAANDGRLLTNFGLTAIGLVAGGLIPLSRITASAFAQKYHLGLGPALGLSWPVLAIATFLLGSLGAYWTHRLMHVVPLFWRVHRVHHADSAVDVSTSLRNHPLELLVTVPVSLLAVVALGAPPTAVVASQTLLIAAALWQHADIDLPPAADRFLSMIIITPRLHRLHHNPERAVHDTNFGDAIIIWDRLFGTLRLTAASPDVGLKDQRSRADHIVDQLCSPLYGA
jgi:sterol desaturase/sphingolipid hydroxylase (fatty acid hydroxylase superfamily)